VYALLGGKTKDRLPVYCTTAKADVAKRHGFAGAKVPCPHGPAAGDEGFRANVAYFKAQREKVGPDFPLMLDCYMALTLPYTVRLAKALEPHGLKWIEECLPPDDYDGYKELRQALLGSSVLVTTGEHEYSRRPSPRDNLGTISCHFGSSRALLSPLESSRVVLGHPGSSRAISSPGTASGGSSRTARQSHAWDAAGRLTPLACYASHVSCPGGRAAAGHHVDGRAHRGETAGDQPRSAEIAPER